MNITIEILTPGQPLDEALDPSPAGKGSRLRRSVPKRKQKKLTKINNGKPSLKICPRVPMGVTKSAEYHGYPQRMPTNSADLGASRPWVGASRPWAGRRPPEGRGAGRRPWQNRGPRPSVPETQASLLAYRWGTRSTKIIHVCLGGFFILVFYVYNDDY